jgi:hypothetical protein
MVMVNTPAPPVISIANAVWMLIILTQQLSSRGANLGSLFVDSLKFEPLGTLPKQFA